MRSLTRAVVGVGAVLAVGAIGVPAVALTPDAGGLRAQALAASSVQSQEYWLGPDFYNIAKAWQLTRGDGVTVAVLDSGVQASLPELSGQVVAGANFVSGHGNGMTDVQDPAFPASVPYGHGTDMAAVIAANGKGNGYVGIAPGAKIMPVVALGAASTTDSITQGIRYAVDHGAQVINISGGQTISCPADMQSAVLYAYQHNVAVVASTGNESASVSAPANCVGALAVGAATASFVPYAMESFGPELDFVAPSSNVPSLRLDGGIYTGEGATSVATAMVSGIVALVRAKYPQDTLRQLITRLLWNVHNGLGGKVFAKRVNDHLGYGAPLPYPALTEAPPAGAANPISDAVAAYLKAHPAASSAPAASTSTAPSAATASSKKSSSGSSAVLLALVIGFVVVVGVLAIALSRRSQRGRAERTPIS